MYCSGKGSSRESQAGHHDSGDSKHKPLVSLKIERARMISVRDQVVAMTGSPL